MRQVETDVVVLGVGSGGEYAARRLARAGLDVVAVEARLVGGECPFWGCTPSKLMIHAAREGRTASSAARRIREATHDWHDDGHTEPMESAGVRIVRGHGRLDGPGRVRVETDEGPVLVTGRRGVLLNTGTSPAVPPVAGLAGTPYWTNREVFGVEEAPGSLAVLGAGNIGCELAQAFGRLGSRVTLLESAERILGPEEPEASEVVARVLRQEGIDVRTRTEVERVGHDGTCFELTTGSGVVRAAHLLVATGRRPHLDDVGLETVGLAPTASTVRASAVASQSAPARSDPAVATAVQSGRVALLERLTGSAEAARGAVAALSDSDEKRAIARLDHAAAKVLTGGRPA